MADANDSDVWLERLRPVADEQVTAAFLAMWPQEANDCFGADEISYIVRQAMYEATQTLAAGYEDGSKAGYRDQRAYLTVKRLTQIKESRLAKQNA